MKFRRWLPLVVAAPLIAVGCNRVNEAMTAHTNEVARAAGKELKVEEAARLLATNPQIPADPQVVAALAEVWTDYTLLATAVAKDSTLAGLDMKKFVEPAREQMLIYKLREKVIHPDTVLTPAQVEQAWVTEGPGLEVRARHILLKVMPDATPAQRDSVKALAEKIQKEAAGGADFAALARQYSQDGSAQQGGDLGYFGRGRMVAPFEEAAFKLQPGQVSPVVETPFGYHIIKVEDRRQPPLPADQRVPFEQFLKQRRINEAETTYLDSLSAAADVKIQEGALALAKEVGSHPNVPLKGRAGARAIATYKGGELTAGELAEFARTQPAQMQAAFASATDEQLKGFIEQMVRKDLLLKEAERQGIKLTPEEEKQLTDEAHATIQQVVQMSGFTPGDAAHIDTEVKQLLEAGIQGTRPLAPLGRLAAVLREQYGASINEASFPKVVAALEKLRPAQGAPGAPGAAPQGAVPQGEAVPPGEVAPPPAQ